MSQTPEIARGNFHAVDERTDRDNFHTSIYERDYDGLLIARCNQNGAYPWQARALLAGLNGVKEAAELLTAEREAASQYRHTAIGLQLERDQATAARVKAEARAERMWCLACCTVSRDDTCDCTKAGTAHLRRAVNYADAQRARAEKAEAELRHLKETEGVEWLSTKTIDRLQDAEERAEKAEAEAKRLRATCGGCIKFDERIDLERAAREAALREAAAELMPKNDPSDWTTWATHRAEAARAILALIPKEPSP